MLRSVAFDQIPTGLDNRRYPRPAHRTMSGIGLHCRCDCSHCTTSCQQVIIELTQTVHNMSRKGPQPAVFPVRQAPEIDASLLSSVAKQLLSRRWVVIEGRRLPTRRSSRQYLRMVNFAMNGREFLAIEQNAAKPSYWAQLARAGHEVVQFKDVVTGRFVAVAVDGVVREYAAMHPSHEMKKSA